MELEPEPEIYNSYVNNTVMDYCKCVKDSEEVCMICLCVKREWMKYQLRCGHQFHTRCYRKWLATKNKLNCTLCGDLAENDSNTYCQVCDKFCSHTWDKCALLYRWS